MTAHVLTPDAWERKGMPVAVIGPANIEAEQALLGAVLMNPDSLSKVIGFLKPEHFSEQLHQRIYDVATQLFQSGKVASPITLKTYLGDHDLGPNMPTIPVYLARLAANATTVLNAPDYARTIVDLAVRREIKLAGEQLAQDASYAEIGASPAAIAESAISRLHEIGMTGEGANTRRSPGKSASELIERAKRIMAHESVDDGVSTCIPDLDRDTGGFQPGALWIVGGRPGMGKSILGTGFASKVARRGFRDKEAGNPASGAMLFSLEIPENQITARLLSDLTYKPRRPIPFGSIMRGCLNESDVWDLEDAQKRLDQIPLALDVASGLTVAQIALKVRAEKTRMAKLGFRLGVVFIDYLKFIKASDRYRGQRVYEVGEISGALKQLAKNEGICVVLLAQLNRALEHRDRKDRRPTLSDLRESGDLEADADVVAFIHREAYYIKQSAEYRSSDPEAQQEYLDHEHEAEIILGKTRAGPTGTIKLWCDVACSTFAAEARGAA